MLIRGIIEEDFVQYRKPSMVIMMPYCDWKCGKDLCQNSPMALTETQLVNPTKLALRYMSNFLTDAIVFSGLEPMDSYEEMLVMIQTFRNMTTDDIVIYTGYNKGEIIDKMTELKLSFPNIYIKFGRFIPYQQPHYDEVLGVYLASDNQYAEKIS